jgi:hypothetical protein
VALARARAHATRVDDAMLLPAPARARPYQCAPAPLLVLAAQDLAVSQASLPPATAAGPASDERLDDLRLRSVLAHGQRWARVAPAPAADAVLPDQSALVLATPCARAVAALAAAQLVRAEHGRALLSRHATDVHLSALLPHADRAAREHARAALAATGAVPAAARQAFHSAREHGHTGDPAGALARFWTASLHAELAVTLARHAR